jgi:hypothetical protein
MWSTLRFFVLRRVLGVAPKLDDKDVKIAVLPPVGDPGRQVPRASLQRY